MASDLVDLEVQEVSLVRKPANKKRFFLSKKEEQMHSLTTAILSMPDDTDGGGAAGILKQELSKEAAQVLGDVKKLLEAVKEELSPELMDRLAESLGLRSERREEEEKDEIEEGAQGESDALKADDIFKSDDPAVMALFKRHQELESLYKSELFEKKRIAYVSKAEKELPNIPGIKSKDLGELLSEIDDLSPKHADKVEGVLKSINSFAQESRAFIEVGSASTPEDGQGAEQKLDSLARARVAKTGEQYAVAYSATLKERPELYKAYLEGSN